jgi:regulator of replication initiation timing
MTGRNIDWWSNPDELSQKVTAGLYKQFTRTKRPGWIRGDAIDVEKSLAEILELNKRLHRLEDENKNLLLENRKLKEKSERKPFLTISMAVDEGFDAEEKEQIYYQHGEFIHIDEADTVHIKVGKVYTNNIEAEYYPVSRSDFFGELRTHISDKEIYDYNEALPSEETLKKYIEKYIAYKRVQDFGVVVTVYINNLGTTKATDISATIEFPDEVRVYDITKVEDMKEPEAPDKPENLIQKAYIRAHRSEMAFKNAMGQIDADIFQVCPSVHFPDLPRFTRQIVMDESVLIEDNVVEIEDKSGIVHTKSDWYRGCYLVALQPGEYMAKVTLMCAEYENPEVSYIKFVCEE